MDYKSETIKTYDLHSNIFDSKFEEHFRNHVKEKADRFLSRLKGKNILDLGSGPGNHAVYFKEKGFDVICLDLSSEMLMRCKEKGLEIMRGDLENLDFNEEFDGIWAYASLIHLPKEKIIGVLDLMKMALNPGGIIGIAMKEGEGEGYEEDERYPGTKRWFSYYRQDELEELFREAGFEFIDNGKSVGKTTTYLHYLLHL